MPCAICLEEVQNGVTLSCVENGCVSEIHTECAEGLFESGIRRCPTCRREVTRKTIEVSHLLRKAFEKQIKIDQAWKNQAEQLILELIARIATLEELLQ